MLPSYAFGGLTAYRPYATNAASRPITTAQTSGVVAASLNEYRAYTAASTRVSSARHLRAAALWMILNHMVQYAHARLDASFAALSDVTRRGVLEHLGRADASITDLADRFRMTLTGMKKHVSVLEQAGLVVTEKVGRVRTCKLGARRLEEETAWIERYRMQWDERFDELDRVVAERVADELKRKKKNDANQKRK